MSRKKRKVHASWEDKYALRYSEDGTPLTLGEGGNAVVYMALNKDGNSDETIALKILNQSAGNEKKERFKRECLAVTEKCASIDGVIPILDYDDNEMWYTMPIAEPLMAHVKNTNATLEQTIKGCLELCDTLIEVHDIGLAHRDIKPDNLYYYNHRYSIADFGLVGGIDGEDETHLTKSGHWLGPIFTIAPEMLVSPWTVEDARPSDVFSLAKTLWMLLTRINTGFMGQYNAYVNEISLSTVNPALAQYPLRKLEEALTLATSYTPAKRQSMKEFREQLAEFVQALKNWPASQKSYWEESMDKAMLVAADTRIWRSLEKIVSVLNGISSRNDSVNCCHLLLPEGGGADFFRAELAAEEGCITLECEVGSHIIVKPECLLLEHFDVFSELDYYIIRCAGLPPIEQVRIHHFCQYLVEDVPGHYVSADGAVYGVYDYDKGDALPDGFRLVTRYCEQANFLFVCKTGVYNEVDGYLGLHNSSGLETYRLRIADITQRMQTSTRPVRVLRTAIQEQERALLFEEKSVSDETNEPPPDFLKLGCKTWRFDLPTEPDAPSLLSYYIKLEPLEGCLLSDKPMSNYLCKDGYFRKSRRVNEGTYLFSSRETLYVYLNKCRQHVAKMCEHAGYNVTPYMGFTVGICRGGLPEHLFSPEELAAVMREADDRHSHQLVIDEKGYVHCLRERGMGASYPVCIEGFDGGNNIVGKYASLSQVNYYYFLLLCGWKQYLENRERSVYVDFPCENTTVEELRETVLSYYER